MGCAEATPVKLPQQLPSRQNQGQPPQPSVLPPSAVNPPNNQHQNPQNPNAAKPQERQLNEGQQVAEGSKNSKEEIKKPTVPVQSNTEMGGMVNPFLFNGNQLSSHIQTTLKENNLAKK